MKLPFAVHKSVKEAKEILKKLSPSVIFTKGGYVSLPVSLAGLSLKIPVFCHESDYSVGLANKVAYKAGATLLTSFSDTYFGKKRVVHVGTPLRKEIFLQNDELQKGRKNKSLLILGGSQGSRAINEEIRKILPQLTELFDVYHITGKGNSITKSQIEKFIDPTENDFNKIWNKYHQFEYTNNIEKFYTIADLAISRGGANSLFELIALKIPTLTIPLAKASRGDQVENAIYFQKRGLLHILQEENISNLFESVMNVEENSDIIKTNLEKYANPDGREKIIKLLLSFE